MASILSVIIPAINEAENLASCIKAIRQHSFEESEIIVVDGGSIDKTVDVARGLGARVLETQKSRAIQMNYGARCAKGDIFLFLHADSILPKGYQNEIKRTLLQTPGSIGAFRLKIDSKKRHFRLLELLIDLRSRLLGYPYGDQGLFMEQDTFWALGGFPDQPIMEDFELVHGARRTRKVVVSKLPIKTSDRRWEKLGIFKTTMINQCIIMAYILGASRDRLYDIYYGKKEKAR